MKKKLTFESNLLKNLMLFTFCGILLSSCNEDPKSAESETSSENSFFDGVFSRDTSKDLNVTSEGIAAVLESDQLQLHQREKVLEFYKNRSNAAAWNNSEDRSAFFDELKKAQNEGLEYNDYHGQKLDALMQDPANLSIEVQANLEILLSDAFFEYASHLFYGKLNPARMYKHWGVNRQDKDFEPILATALKNGEIQESLANLKPNQQVYKDLKKSLEQYRDIKNKEEAGITKIEKGPVIKSGEKNVRIPALVQRLKELEVLENSYTSQDSTYDSSLQEAVKNFQKKKGLQVDGILGNSTIRELNMTPEDRYNQILANLERWRWYPRDLGEHYILVNIPAFELAVVQDGDTVRNHDVIAGAKARPTPVFSDTLQYIVINPEWTIPPTIKEQDVIPSASADLSYLENNNISIYSNDGEQVDPAAIDWNNDNVMNYNFVQESGPSNPLGRVKIIYPNDYLIYLHDTPAKALFQQNYRAESSGCVRVENTIDLAAYVVEDQEWDLEKINQTIHTGKTTQVKIKSRIQVHHFYWTAWRDNGKTVFTEDVYDLDREVYTALLQD
ncbi:L,D-transpeptidase family protein [Salinimicrobium sp. GXAS 041]|uniref:L,D-transpeptidase family protein n=1 Tax=Salinimicrobium sp. GXAS 041 TaxID=3400806 RepID=UPI003C722FAD